MIKPYASVVLHIIVLLVARWKFFLSLRLCCVFDGRIIFVFHYVIFPHKNCLESCLLMMLRVGGGLGWAGAYRLACRFYVVLLR